MCLVTLYLIVHYNWVELGEGGEAEEDVDYICCQI
jgi:hypothetical protein